MYRVEEVAHATGPAIARDADTVVPGYPISGWQPPRRDTHALAVATHAALEDPRHVQLARDVADGSRTRPGGGA
jgi:hypothetical protein